MVGAKGFEPSTPWSQTKYSNQTELRPDTKKIELYNNFTKKSRIIIKLKSLIKLYKIIGWLVCNIHSLP